MKTQAEFERQKASDKRAFVEWLNQTSYDNAERCFRDGTLSEDGWTCYRVVWALSAPRFSSLADFGRNLVHRACAENGRCRDPRHGPEWDALGNPAPCRRCNP